MNKLETKSTSIGFKSLVSFVSRGGSPKPTRPLPEAFCIPFRTGCPSWSARNPGGQIKCSYYKLMQEADTKDQRAIRRRQCFIPNPRLWQQRTESCNERHYEFRNWISFSNIITYGTEPNWAMEAPASIVTVFVIALALSNPDCVVTIVFCCNLSKSPKNWSTSWASCMGKRTKCCIWQ